MKLNEIFEYGENGFDQQKNYNAEDDISILDSENTRKTRLTLKDINKMRLASEHHDQEQKAESEFVQKMYAQPQAEDNISL
jgi:hypothetical protein